MNITRRQLLRKAFTGAVTAAAAFTAARGLMTPVGAASPGAGISAASTGTLVANASAVWQGPGLALVGEAGGPEIIRYPGDVGWAASNHDHTVRYTALSDARRAELLAATPLGRAVADAVPYTTQSVEHRTDEDGREYVLTTYRPLSVDADGGLSQDPTNRPISG